MRLIRGKYSSKCRSCKKQIVPGDHVGWQRGIRGVICESCYQAQYGSQTHPPIDHGPVIPEPKEPETTGKPIDINAPAIDEKNEANFSIDWSELKEICSSILEENTYPQVRQRNKQSLESCIRYPTGSFTGYTAEQLQEWLQNGFQTEELHAIEEFVPPLREKRKFLFTEDGDEFHFDLFLTGSDKPYSEFTKRDVIPGISLNVLIGFRGTVNAAVVIAYSVWVCKVAYSLEAAGIDSEILLQNTSTGLMSNFKGTAHTRVRVKKENEVVDVTSFSPMLSPAAFRSLMFAAKTIHAQSRHADVARNMGYSQAPGWGVNYNEESSRVEINCDAHAKEFPEEMMNMQLRDALRAIMGKQE